MIPARKGDGTGLSFPGYSEVRKGDGTVLWSAAPAIPDSVLYQFTAGNFASPWPDNAGSADMTVNGLTSATFPDSSDAVSGDGVDGHGLASGPEDFGSRQSFGLAFTINFTNVGDGEVFFGAVTNATTSAFVYSSNFNGGEVGNIRLFLRDSNSNSLVRGTGTTTYDDGNTHAVVINKRGNTASDVDIYVDDMTTEADSNTANDQGFDPANYSMPNDCGFFARNLDSGVDSHTDMDAGVFEFWDSPLNQSEREEFVSRRPEV